MTPSIDKTLHQFLTVTDLDIITEFDRYWSGHYYRVWPFTLLCEVSIEHLQLIQYANRGRLLLRTPGPVPLSGLACVLMLRPISPELVLFPDFWVSNILRYFSFASIYKQQNKESIERYSLRKFEKRHGMFGKTGLNNWNISKPPTGGQNQVYRRVSVPCWHVAPVA